MTATETTTTAEIPDIVTQKAEVLARLYLLLVDMGADVEVAQGELDSWHDGMPGRITKVNGFYVAVNFKAEKLDSWERRNPRLQSVSVIVEYTDVPSANYQRGKGGFSIQRMAERLDAVTRAAGQAKKAAAAKAAQGERNRAALEKAFNTTYSYTDYKRNIHVSSDDDGFKVTVNPRRFKTIEAAQKFLADIQKFLDDRTAS